MSEIHILKSLKSELTTFFDELISLMPEEGDIVIIRFWIGDKFPIQDIMEHIIANLLPIKDLVKTRNEDFFLKNNVLFDQLDSNKVNYFKKLWCSGTLDEDDKVVIWKWFQRILLRAEKYQNLTST
jgi:hypothetical protein